MNRKEKIMNFLMVAVKRIFKIYVGMVFILVHAIFCLFFLIPDEEKEKPGKVGQVVEIERGSEKHIKLILEWAYKGFAPAQYDLGACYEEGNGVTQDLTKAERWYRKAAQQGDELAIEALKRLQNEEAENKQ